MYQPYILKYNYNALEPYISKKTLETHYNSHYLKYLKNLNTLLLKNDFKFQYPVSYLFQNIDAFQVSDREEILYNAGGVLNHEIYFDSMKPASNTIIPEPLLSNLTNKFGSINNFIKLFNDLAISLKGSGYIFLATKPNGELHLLSIFNQESVYSSGMIPLFCIDVWEHSYYLDYQNNRGTYLDSFFKIINFDLANKKYQEVLNFCK